MEATHRRIPIFILVLALSLVLFVDVAFALWPSDYLKGAAIAGGTIALPVATLCRIRFGPAGIAWGILAGCVQLSIVVVVSMIVRA